MPVTVNYDYLNCKAKNIQDNFYNINDEIGSEVMV